MADVESLFPLRLTPFEYYFLVEDVPECPQHFYIRIDCCGTLDRQAFAAAYAIAHQRHPLLSARIEYDRRGWPMWMPGEPAPICWKDNCETAGITTSAVETRPRVQIRVAESAGETCLSVTFDHVATDGMGGFQFISDLMVAYAKECGCADAASKRWRPVAVDLLRQRDRQTLFSRKFRPVDLLRWPRQALPLLLRSAAVLSDHGQRVAPGGSVTTAGKFLVHTLSEEESAALAKAARNQSVRLHDLLLRDYFLMLRAWNQGTPEGRLPLRVMVPMNMRQKQDLRMPAANMFGFTFMMRQMKDCHDRQALLASVRDEMAAMKRTRWALYHELGLQLFSWWPWMMRKNIRRDWTFATAVFTNLNAGFDHVPLPWRDGRRVAGNLRLENGYGAGPIRPNTRLSLAVHSYAGRMSIAVRADETVFTPKQQDELLQAYLQHLRETIAREG